jgi:Uma2 family endonuclease
MSMVRHTSTSKSAVAEIPVAEPAWEIAELFPYQGGLSESDYLFVTRNTNRLAEFTDGRIEVLKMPTLEHQRIVLLLINLLQSFIAPRGLGDAIMAPLRVKLREGKFREPDVMFMLQRNISRARNEFWDGADLVIEVVSEDDPKRDLEIKRGDYAEAGIPEYWIVDPRNKKISVLKLEGTQYVVHAEADGSGIVQSALLAGFNVDAATVFAAGRRD